MTTNLRATFADNVENLDKKVEDCRRKLLKRPWWSLDTRYQLLDKLSDALRDRFRHLGGIEYIEESITCNRQGLNLCPIGHPDHSVTSPTP